jgi:hypothetical protein
MVSLTLKTGSLARSELLRWNSIVNRLAFTDNVLKGSIDKSPTGLSGVGGASMLRSCPRPLFKLDLSILNVLSRKLLLSSYALSRLLALTTVTI